MSIDGRITVDCLFHDKDGTAALKVLSLESSDAYTTGKVAIITGTVGTAVSMLSLGPSAYRDASGALVSFTTLTRAAIKAEGNSIVLYRFVEYSTGETASSTGTLVPPGSVCVVGLNNNDLDPLAQASPALQCPDGTASYTIVIQGT